MQICRREREREHQCESVCVLGGGMGGGGGCVSDSTDHLPMLDHLSVSSVQCTVYSGLYRGLYTTPATQTVSLSPATHTHRRALSTTLISIYLPTNNYQLLLMNKIESYISPGVLRLNHHDSVSINLCQYFMEN